MIWTRLRFTRSFDWKVLTFAFLLCLLPGVASVAGADPIVVRIGQNFTASTLNVDSTSVPPDSDGASGPLHYVELINGRFSVFNKSDGTKVKTMSDATFWSQAGIILPSGWDVTDPRVIYDPAVQRWFVSQVDFDPTGTVNTNSFFIAVSANADPTGAWKAVSIPSDPGGNDFADYPTLGLDANGVYISGDMFDANSNPVGPTLVAIPKAGLLANPPTTAGLTWFGVMSYNARGDILQPVICVDGSDEGQIFSAASIGLDLSGNFVTNTSVVSFKVQNVAGPGKATLSNSKFLTVLPYTVPLDPTQPDGSSNLDDGDARLSACVREVGGILYAVHNTEVGNLAALRWYRIDAATQTVLESGTISDPVLDLYYPSIAANSAGTVVIAFNGSSSGTFVSSFATVGSTVNGVTTFGSPLLLKAGTASYQNTDSTGTSRWGDYSATDVDPADPNVFWTIQEIPTSRSRWSTQVTQLLTGFPRISSSLSGTNLQLSWSGTLFTLQSTPGLTTPNWSPASANLSTNNGVVTAQMPVGAGAAGFFRLNAP